MGSALSTVEAYLPYINNYYPPTPAAYTTLLTIFQYFPIVSQVTQCC